MDSTIVVVVLLGFLAVGSCQPPRLPVYQSLEEGPQTDRQIGSLLLGLLTPTITNVLTMGLTNLGSAVYNAFASTFAGMRLELIPLESLFDSPIEGSSSSATSRAAHLHTPGGQPPKRRPFHRSLVLDDNDSHPETSGSS